MRVFEKLAAWGCPFRFMSRGKHSFAVEGDSTEPDFVPVSFACVHFYERWNRENGEEDGKEIPEWMQWWSHKVYARWLLDGTVRRALESK